MQAVLERICRDVTKQARLYQESIRDESELTDKTGVNLYQVRSRRWPRAALCQKQSRQSTRRRLWSCFRRRCRGLGLGLGLRLSLSPNFSPSPSPNPTLFGRQSEWSSVNSFDELPA